MSFLLVAVLSLAAQADDAVKNGVARLVDRHFPSPDPVVRQQWIDRVTHSIQSVADGPLRAGVVKNLPSAFQSQASFSIVSEFLGNRAPPPADLLQEGYGLQVDFLQARIDRISQTPWGREREQAIGTQIDLLARSAANVLKERLQGPVAEKIVDDHFEKLRTSWRASLEDPFTRFLDTPLTPEQFESVIAQMKAKVQTLPLIHLTSEDAADLKRLQKLGVPQAVFEVQEAAFGACGICFQALAGPENRVLEWAKRLDEGLPEALAGRPGPKESPPVPLGPPKKPDGAARPPADPPAQPPHSDASTPSAAPAQEAFPSRTLVVLGVVLVLLATAVFVVLRHRR